MLTTCTAGPGPRDWVVLAQWHGAVRVVFGPTDIYTATQWAAAHKEN